MLELMLHKDILVLNIFEYYSKNTRPDIVIVMPVLIN